VCAREGAGGVRGSMYKVMKAFVGRGCMGLVTSAGRAGVNVDVSAGVELVDGFCCLGDMLGADRDAGPAVDAGFGLDGVSLGGWCRCLLASRDMSLMVRQRLCSSCV